MKKENKEKEKKFIIYFKKKYSKMEDDCRYYLYTCSCGKKIYLEIPRT